MEHSTKNELYTVQKMNLLIHFVHKLHDQKSMIIYNERVFIYVCLKL